MMKPLFIYPIPETSIWYIIITDTSNHFYFDSEDGTSYWQLSELVDKYDINLSQFLSHVNYDQLGLLFAKSRGLKVRTNEEKGKKSHQKSGSPTKEPTQGDTDDAAGEVEILYENEYVNKGGNGETTEPSNETVEEKQSSPVGIVTGYSSSEEEEEEEEKGEEKEGILLELQNAPTKVDNGVDDIVAKVLDQQDVDDDQSDNESQVSLDLSLDDESEEKTSATIEFEKMLNEYSSQISSFESWDIIEDQLVKEFIKYPIYHSIGSRREKADIFQNWLDNREVEEDGAVSTDSEGAKLFPTAKIQFLSLLQNHRDQVKTAFYQEFYVSHYKDINEIDLPKSSKEEVYRSYKTFILDFAKFEKNFKKSAEYQKGVNVKVMKLEGYLSSQGDFPSGSFTIDPELSCFDNWIQLLNQFFKHEPKIPEAEINFLVGDEKRLNSYIAKLKSPE
ncbi:hypothetical protein I9W82_003042 [Candida metapsilosis]|uniref:FF domain-containing protein n=1 Tax=Candida metapsilosis TaxID=273372 RepID=A0A8H7ZCE3_9ASCO|nr:hypothetical protein I9W82_003042 [Candida metapsilosis]